MARELGLDAHVVTAVIEGHRDVFRRSAVAPAGVALYRPAEGVGLVTR